MSSCKIDKNKKIKWKIQNINKIIGSLNEPSEVAGLLPIDFTNKTTTSDITINYGEKDSVQAPMSMINYHTHPAHCYITEKTVWGFPSGEDIRETILFCFKGSVAHLVIAVEGTYIIQVNQSMVSKLINLEVPDHIIKKCKLPKDLLNDSETIHDLARGLVIKCIEMYFRTTHAFRTLEFIKKYENITPEDYSIFCNQFDLEKLFTNSEQKCGNFICSNFWAFEHGRLKKYEIEEYIKNYEYDETMYIVSPKGHVRNPNYKIDKYVQKYGLDIIKHTFSDSITKWFTVTFFPHYIKGLSGFYTELSIPNKMTTLKSIQNGEYTGIEIKTDPYFIYYNMEGNCNYQHIKKDLNNNDNDNSEIIDFKNKYILIGSPSCVYCEKAKKELDKKKLKYTYVYHKNIKEAIEKGNKIVGTLNKRGYKFSKIQSIPVLLDLDK